MPGFVYFLGGRSVKSARPATLGVLVYFLAGALVVAFAVAKSATFFLDLRVYREALTAWDFGRSGLDLYAVQVTDVNLPFTYPPFSTLLLAPFSALPLPLSAALLTALGVVCVATVVVTSFRGLGVPVAVTFPAAAVLLFATPVRETFDFGQVNLLLMGLVGVDMFLMARSRLHGVLVGVAASVKLTPAVFLLLPVARRQWRALAVGGFTIVACLTLSTLVLQAETVKYFTSVVFDPTRPGNPAFVSNQALSGALARLGYTSLTLWVLLAGVCVVVAVVVAARAPHPSVAVLAIALGGLLASPISWAHHWVWVCVAPAAAWALYRSGFRLASGVTVAFLVVVYLWNPMFLEQLAGWPDTQSPWAVVASTAYTAAGLAWLAIVAFALTRSRANIAQGIAGDAVNGDRAAQPASAQGHDAGAGNAR